MRLDIVVPCFNEEDVLEETARRLEEVLEALTVKGKIDAGSRICFVDDGSRDASWAIIERLAARTGWVRGIKLSRNRGHQNALLAGLLACRGDAAISLDADLQDDPQVIEQMVDAYHAGYDIAYGVRTDRQSDKWFKRVSAALYYRLLSALGIDVVANHADFRLLSRRALQSLGRFREAKVVPLYFLGGIQLLSIGIIGEYLARVYAEVKGRPR